MVLRSRAVLNWGLDFRVIGLFGFPVAVVPVVEQAVLEAPVVEIPVEEVAMVMGVVGHCFLGKVLTS